MQTPKQPTARRGHQAALDSPADAFAPSSQFTREDLANATVIGQVDKKFIACVIESTTDPPHEDSLDPSRPPSGKTSTLVVIDQHAADERVRVERYLQGVCMGFLGYAHGAGVKTRVLDPPEAVLLTMHELRPLRDSEDIQDAFARWGVTFGELCDTQGADLSADDDESVYAQVEVVTIPEVVADKVEPYVLFIHSCTDKRTCSFSQERNSEIFSKVISPHWKSLDLLRHCSLTKTLLSIRCGRKPFVGVLANC